MSDIDKDLELAKEFFNFLQGTVPDGYSIQRKARPKLTALQAWTVIWYLGGKYRTVSDAVSRCDVCGVIYHTHREGKCLDFGKVPYDFCENCMASDEYALKSRSKLNPDR